MFLCFWSQNEKYFKKLPAKISSHILTQKPQRGYHTTRLFSIWCSIGNTFTHHEDKCCDKGWCHTRSLNNQPSTPLAGEANNLKSQSQQEGMWLEAQVNLYNMWTPIGKSDVKKFFQLISCLFTYWHICKQRVKIFFSPSSKKISKNNFWK